MKRFILTFIILAAALTLFAQKGLFGISYDDSYQAVKTNLTSYDPVFTLSEENGNKCVYTSPDNDYIDHLVVYFDKPKGNVVMWQVFYLDQEDEDIEDVAVNAAEDWHGDNEWDDDYECYYWEFGDGKTLYIGYNTDYWIVAEYYNDSYAEYSELILW